jgi:hypothetical protein
MDQREDTNAADYPRGRGYGHDYMRGGEVFGGYGYADRADYRRPRGQRDEGSAIKDEVTFEEEAGEDPDPSAATPPFPQDARAGEWGADTQQQLPPSEPGQEAGGGPVPHLEHAFGGSPANHYHSRSYFVTQAQLQQRVYGARIDRGPYADRLRTLRREDADLLRDVREVLFHDTWVDAERIDVQIEEGIVTLRGTLASEEEIRFACNDAWSVAGVREVRSELKMREGRAD